jgi:hypothetical protein
VAKAFAAKKKKPNRPAVRAATKARHVGKVLTTDFRRGGDLEWGGGADGRALRVRMEHIDTAFQPLRSRH